MTELKCTVQTCVHNKQFLCDRETIEVGGIGAKSARETCCDSFQERRNDYEQYSDITEDASELTNIECKAVECMYNRDCECHAGRISVEGSNATQNEGTECATFTYAG